MTLDKWPRRDVVTMTKTNRHYFAMLFDQGMVLSYFEQAVRREVRAIDRFPRCLEPIGGPASRIDSPLVRPWAEYLTHV